MDWKLVTRDRMTDLPKKWKYLALEIMTMNHVSFYMAQWSNICNFVAISTVLRKKGQSDILMKSQTICMYSNSLGKKGQYARTNCINCFNKTYQNNLCSLALQINLFYLMNLNAHKQFGSSSKCQIGPFCATPSNNNDEHTNVWRNEGRTQGKKPVQRVVTYTALQRQCVSPTMKQWMHILLSIMRFTFVNV